MLTMLSDKVFFFFHILFQTSVALDPKVWYKSPGIGYVLTKLYELHILNINWGYLYVRLTKTITTYQINGANFYKIAAVSLV